MKTDKELLLEFLDRTKITYTDDYIKNGVTRIMLGDFGDSIENSYVGFRAYFKFDIKDRIMEYGFGE